MDPQAYKVFHESFMQNNNGTSAVETFLVILPSFFTTFLVISLTSALSIASIPVRLLLEFLVIVVPIIALVTVASDYVLQINVALLVLSLTLLLPQLKGKWHLEPFVQIPSRRPQYLTIMRGLVNIITAVCILAVDFQCFPRSLAKTETFGFGLMDTGVGLFVLMNGVVSAEARMERYDWRFMKKSLLGVTPLVSLGLIRFFVTNEIDYQQHVSEYGVHWNFFMTLAAVRLFGCLVLGLLGTPKYAHFLCFAVLCCHEVGLHLGLSDYVMTAKRDTFVDANREGLVSIPGYIALYLISVWVGSLIKNDREFERPKEKTRLLLKIALIVLVSWKMTFVCDGMFGTSRRLANMSYCFWMAAIASSMLLLFMLMEIALAFISFNKTDSEKESKMHYVPLLYEAINYNGLVFFLFANILTGLVNMVFQTMLLGTVASLTIISYYAFTIFVVMAFLQVNQIKMKFW